MIAGVRDQFPNDPGDPEEEFASHILARAASSVESREVTLYFE